MHSFAFLSPHCPAAAARARLPAALCLLLAHASFAALPYYYHAGALWFISLFSNMAWRHHVCKQNFMLKHLNIPPSPSLSLCLYLILLL